jgi:hypothetical protein
MKKSLIKFLATTIAIAGLSSSVFADKKYYDKDFHINARVLGANYFMNSDLNSAFGNLNFLSSLGGSISGKVNESQDFSVGIGLSIDKDNYTTNKDHKEKDYLELKSNKINPFIEFSFLPGAGENTSYFRAGPVTGDIKASAFNSSGKQESISEKVSGFKVAYGNCLSVNDSGLAFCSELAYESLKAKDSGEQFSIDSGLSNLTLTFSYGY